MKNQDTIRLALKLLSFLGISLVAMAIYLIYRNPEGMGGYLTASFAALQLVISKVGEAIRAGKEEESVKIDEVIVE